MIENPNDPSLRSFIDVDPASPFPIQNLPFGFFSDYNPLPRPCVAIGEYVVDLDEIAKARLFGEDPHLGGRNFYHYGYLIHSPGYRRTIRQRISELLRHDNPQVRDNASLRTRAIIPQRHVQMLL